MLTFKFINKDLKLLPNQVNVFVRLNAHEISQKIDSTNLNYPQLSMIEHRTSELKRDKNFFTLNMVYMQNKPKLRQ